MVESRAALAQMLTERMQGTYDDLRGDQRLGRDRSLLKTWVLETAQPSSRDSGPETVLESAFSNEALGDAAAPSVTRLASDLLRVDATRNDERLHLYVDVSDTRFWLLHSLDRSTSVDWAITRAVYDALELDTLWLTPDLLDWVAGLGRFRGLSLDFDRRPITGEDEDEAETEDGNSELAYLKLQLWGNKARRVLETLRAEDAFPGETTLAKVKVKYYPDEAVPDVFSLDDVKFNGKVTARGSSFDAHRGLLTRLLRRYSSIVEGIESNYAVSYERWTSDSNKALFNIRGEALNVLFSRPMQDMEPFLSKVFASSEPFRLWGEPVEYGVNRYKVEAFDLHVGCPVRFEVSPKGVRIYLPQDACGNSVMRFITNVQHHFDAAAMLLGGGGERVGIQP